MLIKILNFNIIVYFLKLDTSIYIHRFMHIYPDVSPCWRLPTISFFRFSCSVNIPFYLSDMICIPEPAFLSSRKQPVSQCINKLQNKAVKHQQPALTTQNSPLPYILRCLKRFKIGQMTSFRRYRWPLWSVFTGHFKNGRMISFGECFASQYLAWLWLHLFIVRSLPF